MKPLKLAVFISGRGTNLQSIIDACKATDFPAKIEVVISNRPDAKGLERAQKAKIETRVVDHKDYKSREDFEDALLVELGYFDADLICLAGFMRILTPYFINSWHGEIINIHPSLLPDYKGTNTHDRVLADGKKETGCTIHYVVPEVDSGDIIIQKRVPIRKQDTPKALSDRVLKQEHIAYPEAIKIVAAKIRNKNLENSHTVPSTKKQEKQSKMDNNMGHHIPVEVSEEQTQRAEEMWGAFAHLMKWSIIATVSILALLGLLFVDWA